MPTHKQMHPFVRLVVAVLASLGSTTALEFTPGEILFKTRDARTRPAADLLGLPGIATVTPLVRGNVLRKPASAVGRIYRADLQSGHTVEAVLRRLRDRADIEYAQPNHLFRPFQATNDPRLGDQVHLDIIGWPALIAALPGKQRDVVVGVIDSGVDYNHEDLADRIWINTAEVNGRPGVDDDGNGYIDDVRGWDFSDAPNLPGQGDFTETDNDPMDESSHGTGVAGVIGAIADNGIGVAGVADCRLMAVRAGLTFDQGGTFLQEDDLAAAITYAVDNGADVLNLSWGSFDRAFVIEDAVRYATDRGVVVVAAAGNTPGPIVAYPAALPGVISVGAVDDAGQLAGFSSYGHVLDLVAPGVNIVSTRLDDAYGPRSGTSFAAPQVTGLAALLLSRRPELDPDRVRGALVASVTDLGAAGWDAFFGAGRADGAELVDFVNGADPVAARILSPDVDDAVSATTPVVASVGGFAANGYRLSWSRNTNPPLWTEIASGAPSTSIETGWTVPTGDGGLIIRLDVDAAGTGPIEHRIRVRGNPPPPAVTSLFFGPILEADRLGWTIRWTTSRASSGRVILSAADGRQDTVRSGTRNRFHEIRIPDQHTARTYDFHVEAENGSGAVTRTDTEQLDLIPARIPTIGFTEIASLPDGFLADATSDFDGDGLREIALMPYVEGEPFTPVEIHEYDGGFTRIHTTEQRVLPWNVADVTHDGRPDLLGSAVDRIRLLSGDDLPSDVILDRSGVLGGALADANGDGANEIVLRSQADNALQILRYELTGSFSEVGTLFDPSPGGGAIGSRPLIADLDGDPHRDVLVGDADGDLWSYEFDGTFLQGFLMEGADDTDARVIGGGRDLDGDGRVEFAVARANTVASDPLNGWWDLEIYQIENGQPVLEHLQRISGVANPGNGIATGDLDGDGRSDLAVALIPDLYVFRGDAPDTYRPIFYADISLTYGPVISDIDGDDAPELMFNARKAIRVLERDLPVDTVQRPELLQATALDRTRVTLRWMETPGAGTYRLLRTGPDREDRVVTTGPFLSHVDTGVSSGTAYTYRVEAVFSDTTVRSGPATVTPHAPPAISGVDVIDDHRLAVRFNVRMAQAAADPNQYRLRPAGEIPSSAIRDHGDRRILLAFESAILQDSTYTLAVRKVTDRTGTPVDPNFRDISFTPGSTPSASDADFDADGRVGFGDFLLFAEAFGTTNTTFDLDADGQVGFSDFLIFAELFGSAA